MFDNYQRKDNRAILTDLETPNGNFLVALELGRDGDVDFNIVSSVFGKGRENVLDWYNRGYATYINKEKALSFLFHQSAPIATTAANEELSSAAKVVENFEDPAMGEEKSSTATEKASLRRGTSGVRDIFQEAREARDEEETRFSLRNNNQGSGWSRETMQKAVLAVNPRTEDMVLMFITARAAVCAMVTVYVKYYRIPKTYKTSYVANMSVIYFSLPGMPRSRFAPVRHRS